MRLKNYENPRVVKKFAWLPVTLDDGVRVWLEHYFIEEKFTGNWGGAGWVRLRTWTE